MLRFIPASGRVIFEMLAQPQQCLVMCTTNSLSIYFQQLCNLRDITLFIIETLQDKGLVLGQQPIGNL